MPHAPSVLVATWLALAALAAPVAAQDARAPAAAQAAGAGAPAQDAGTGAATQDPGTGAGARAAAPALATRTLAATCGTCHGTDGRAVPGATVPGLAGQPAALIVERLKAFQSGARPSTVMQQIARGFSDEQIGRLADWFSRRQP